MEGDSIMAVFSPSILNADFMHLDEEIKNLQLLGVQSVHLDVMDGHFVPDLFLGSRIIKDIRKSTTLLLDAHLMIENPENLLQSFIDAGCDSIAIHKESSKCIEQIIHRIKASNIKAGLALSPESSIQSIYSYLEEIDFILVMSIQPGKAGSAFQMSAIDKVDELCRIRSTAGLHFKIAVDGGIGLKEVDLLRGKADIIVAGNSFYIASDKTFFVKSVQS